MGALRAIRLKSFRAERGTAYLTFSEVDAPDMLFTIVGSEKEPERWTQADVVAAAARIAEQYTYDYDGTDFTLAVAPISRLTIVDRMTDEELASALAFFNNGAPRSRRARERWLAATEVDPSNAETVGLFEALYGEARTAELLGPEE